MGEAKRKQSATQKFIEQFPYCYFCGGAQSSATREHMPPVSLFDNSHRPDKLVMPACDRCNRDTSTADLTAAVVSRWNYSSGHQERTDSMKLNAQVRRQAPELIQEWTKLSPLKKEDARQHLRNNGVPVPHDAGIVTLGPFTIRQLNLFAHKVVLALYFEHFRQPLSVTGSVCAFWKTKEDFARDGVPQFLLDMMPESRALVQGQWNTQEIFEYRHAINPTDRLFSCLARFRQGLFVVGLIVPAASIPEPDYNADWVIPAVPSVLLDSPRFQKKL